MPKSVGKEKLKTSSEEASDIHSRRLVTMDYLKLEDSLTRMEVVLCPFKSFITRRNFKSLLTCEFFGLDALTNMKALCQTLQYFQDMLPFQVLNVQGCLHKSGLLILLYPFVRRLGRPTRKFPIS